MNLIDDRVVVFVFLMELEILMIFVLVLVILVVIVFMFEDVISFILIWVLGLICLRL